MKKLIYTLILIFTLNSHFTFAATVPPYSGGINKSIASVLNSKLGKQSALGPEYDAQFQRTMAGITSGINTTATTLVLGGAAATVGAISWPALLISAGVSGVVSGSVSLGVDKLLSWLWPDSTHPNQVQVSGSALGTQTPSYSSGIKAGQTAWTINGGYWGSPQEALSYVFSQSIASYPDVVFSNVVFTVANATTVNITYSYNYPTSLKISGSGTKQATSVTYNGIACIGGQGYVSGTTCTPAGLEVSTNPMANAANPVTSADVADWRKNNPTLAPSVGDFISPVAPVGSTTVPVSVPASPSTSVTTPTPSTSTTTPPTTTDPTLGTKTNPFSIDWGDFTEPASNAPTTESILDPLFNMWPQWASFSFPAHQSQCPQPEFDALRHHFKFDQMCAWVEMIRPAMQASFMLGWALMCIFIVMGA